MPQRSEEITLDEFDHELIIALQIDGGTGYRAPAEVVRRSPSALRSRVQKLIESGVIRIVAIKSGGLAADRYGTRLGITLSDDAEPVRRLILESESIEFAARAHGVRDFVATAGGASSGEVLATVESLRTPESASAVET